MALPKTKEAVWMRFTAESLEHPNNSGDDFHCLPSTGNWFRTGMVTTTMNLNL